MSTQNTSGHFLALTIGPVVKTLLEARKSRELWAASYLLSNLMRHLCAALDPAGNRLLIPRIPADVQNAPLYGAGIYPDRLFMQADGLTDAAVETAIDNALKRLAADCTKKGEKLDEKATLAFWKQFFRIRYVIAELPDLRNGQLSIALSPVLDTLELEDTAFPASPKSDFLLELFDTKNLFQCPLVGALHGNNRGLYEKILDRYALFPATHEIAAFELFDKESEAFIALNNSIDDDKNEQFYQRIEKGEQSDAALKRHFKPRHKYFCIVQADGDNIGKAIQQLNDAEHYRKFSETLALFGSTAAGIINFYGGKPIYIGGDDLLFLAPVRSAQGSVFDLIQALSDSFPIADLHPDASLSFGVNIVYYKFPLFEAISDAYGILHKAKKFNGRKKDAISFRYTKHSGAYFEGVFSKNFLMALASATRQFEPADASKDRPMISSLIFKFNTLQKLLAGLAAHATGNLEARLDYTFDSFFNEWGDDSSFAGQRDAAKQLLLRAFQEPAPGHEGRLKLFYAAMRLIQFIVSPSEKHQYDTENMAATAG